MIESLVVKNFALIKEAKIDFKDNLNILTGETGSGKSILLGSINLALGKRISKDYIRDDGEETSVTISFAIKDDLLSSLKNDFDIPFDDNRIIISRRVSKDKNVVKVNDEPITLTKLREITERLIDIYGQHDGEDLRKDAKHILFLDGYIGEECEKKKVSISKIIDELKLIKDKLDTFGMDEKMRLREIDILKYEIDELTNAEIKKGEEEELSAKYKIYASAKNLISSLNKAYTILQNLDLNSAVKEVKDAVRYDESLDGIYKSLIDADSIVSDNIKELDRKIDMYDVDDSELLVVEDRLNLIRGILAKYDNSVEVAYRELETKKNRLNELINYDTEKEKVLSELKSCEDRLHKACDELTKLRIKYKDEFTEKIKFELKDLGFNEVQFDVNISKKNEPTRDGIDNVVFYISLNKGEKLRPLTEVASGGELSRIMLSIKAVLSDNLDMPTLIFDEIDTGISGITASKVAIKLNKISKNHQVILITHLPQIAAMADSQYVIEKEINKGRTLTIIRELDENGMIGEIGRLISSDGELTDNVIANAKELKDNARKEKEAAGKI